MNKIYCKLAGALITVAISTVSCDSQPDLCFDLDHHGRAQVEVEFDWEGHPYANPATMSLYMFPTDGSQSLRYEFNGREGHDITVPVGTYVAFAINSDSELARILNAHYQESFEISLRTAYEMEGLAERSSSVPRMAGTENERMASQPDEMWHSRLEQFDVKVDYGKTQKLSLRMSRLTRHFSVNIEEVSNMKDVASISATISGLFGSLYPCASIFFDEKVTIPFELNPADENSLTGEIRTLGHCRYSTSSKSDYDPGAIDVSHYLTVYAILNDGTRWYHSFDVTEQMHSGNDVITVSGLNLPEAMATGSGFQVNVDDWNSVMIPLPL